MSLSSLLSRLTLHIPRIPVNTRAISTDKILPFRATACLYAEPLKKKKRIDPAVVKAREERRKKKLEKQIRRLEKNARQLKPIDECEIPIAILNEQKQRKRGEAHNVDELERRVLLEKRWAKYRREQHFKDLKMMDRIMYSQQKALDELRKESEELYTDAIQTDFQLIPLETSGPTDTCAIENYDTPDGDYKDESKKWN